MTRLKVIIRTICSILLRIHSDENTTLEFITGDEYNSGIGAKGGSGNEGNDRHAAVQNRIKHSKSSHLLIPFPSSLGVRKRASEQTGE